MLWLQEPFEHESLLIDRKEHKLTKAEKKAAKKSYEEEKRASVPYTRPSYAQYYPASDQSLTSIPAFSQRNWWVLGFFHFCKKTLLPGFSPVLNFFLLVLNYGKKLAVATS